MTLNDLIEELQDMLDNNPELGDQEIKIALQPNYPLASTIANVTIIDGDDEVDDDECEPQIWIAIDEARGYASKAAWN